jgi:transcription termination factor Rho
MYNIEELRIRLLSELKEIAEELGVKNSKTLKKDELVYAILDQQAIIPEQALPKKKPSVVESGSFLIQTRLSCSCRSCTHYRRTHRIQTQIQKTERH